MLSQEQYEAIEDLVIYLSDEAAKYIGKLYDKYTKNVKNGLNKIAIRVINDYYDYKTTYKREWDLYNAYKIIANDDSWGIIYDSSSLKKHGELNEYIFDYMFGQGYHGGAIDGEGHPNPGIPYWRAGAHFERWGKPAYQDDASPYEIIENECSEYLDEMAEAFIDEFTKWFHNKVNEMKKKVKEIIIGTRW